MKKIDLHIHTVPTIKDASFVFDMEVLKSYIQKISLDLIAITNHNTFDQDQFNLIKKSISIPVLPGIEIDIENGHLLVLTDESDIDDFEKRCKLVNVKIPDKHSYLTEKDFTDIFTDLNKYILIPHYRKKPKLDFARVPNLVSYIKIGEVASEKNFITMKKDTTELVPVLFSDLRMKQGVVNFPNNFTLIDIEELSLSSLKIALNDRQKVEIDPSKGNLLLSVPDAPFQISSGLTVVLGARSFGKTHTLNLINDNFDKVKYIRQFSLVTSSETSEKKKFEEAIQRKSNSVSEGFLAPFKSVVDDVKNINLSLDDQKIDNYLSELLEASNNADKEDVYSKTVLFSETSFLEKSLASLIRLIDSTEVLINTTEYKEIIEKHIARKQLLELAIELRKKYIEESSLEKRKQYVNDIIEDIQKDLSVRTASTQIKDIDFYQILMDKIKINKFEAICKDLRKKRIIKERSLHSFIIKASSHPFMGAQELKSLSKSTNAFTDAFTKYDEPYEFLQILKSKEALTDTELYRYFVAIDYKVFNSFHSEVSGGEMAEFNLLQELDNSQDSEMLILDEPESSFDNLFLKNDINLLLKKISGRIPVIIATHNNTIGASVHPDYILFTRKDVIGPGQVKYLIFSGYPSSEELLTEDNTSIRRKDVLLDCLEAGEEAYTERRTTYEMS